MKNAFEVKKQKKKHKMIPLAMMQCVKLMCLDYSGALIRCSAIGKMIDFFVTKKPKLKWNCDWILMMSLKSPNIKNTTVSAYCTEGAFKRPSEKHHSCVT